VLLDNKGMGVLRLALSAPMLSKMASNPSNGARSSPSERAALLLRDDASILQKIELIAVNFDALLKVQQH